MSSAPSSTKNVCEDGIELIGQLQRNPDIIPKYNENAMRSCIEKTNQLYAENYSDLQTMKDGTCEDRLQCEERIGVKQGCIEFMKRCCLAYLNERKQRLQTFRWKFGEVLPSDIKANLCQAEMDWFNQYTTMLAEYQGSIGENGVNLMTNMKPPKSLFTQVRAIEDYGEFETSDGTVVLLKKNSVHSLPRQDCEMLIKQGFLEIAHDW